MLQFTRDQLLRAAEDPDNADLNALAAVIASDPLMTLRVLRQASAPQRGGLHSAPKTVLEAMILMGTGPLFRSCQDLKVVQDLLADDPEALAGLTLAMARAYRAARIAHRLASMLDDPDAEVIHEVALLHDFTELLLWVYRPRVAAATRRTLTDAERHAHRRQAHHELPVDLVQLGQQLMRAWRLHPQLIRMGEGSDAPTSRAHLIDLAVRLADGEADGDEGPDSFTIADAAQTLKLGADATREVLRRL